MLILIIYSQIIANNLPSLYNYFNNLERAPKRPEPVEWRLRSKSNVALSRECNFSKKILMRKKFGDTYVLVSRFNVYQHHFSYSKDS